MPDSAVKTHLQRLGIASILRVPIIIQGKYWGHIALTTAGRSVSGHRPRSIFCGHVVDMIGGGIIRERYVEELKDANTIVE